MSDALSTGLQMTAVGVTIVFASLMLVSLTLTAMNRGFAALERRAERAAEAEQAAAPPTDGLTPQTLAVIVAAATLAIGRPIRVERVRYREGAPALQWSRQGRATILGSHRVRR